MKTLEYYSSDGTHIVFDNYTIDENGDIMNNMGKVMTRCVTAGGYNDVGVYDTAGKQRHISVGRAIASTFIGKPPTRNHTADHADQNRLNDVLTNIRWAGKSEQSKNRTMPSVFKTAFRIIRNGVEHSAKDWVEVYKKPNGEKYTAKCILNYARQQKYGFEYKTFTSLRGEMWRAISWSKNSQGEWHISSRSRMKYKTKHAENVLNADELSKASGYPVMVINGRQWYCHELSFMTFRPREYATKTPNEMILHKEDDKLDFNPFRLRLGTMSENAIDARDNGKYDNTKTARKAVVSHVNDDFEKEHESISVAVRYLRDNGYPRAVASAVVLALREGVTRYGRTWKTF
jgi:hypothetical protein